jgi:hypothetical protein
VDHRLLLSSVRAGRLDLDRQRLGGDTLDPRPEPA